MWATGHQWINCTWLGLIVNQKQKFKYKFCEFSTNAVIDYVNASKNVIFDIVP